MKTTNEPRLKTILVVQDIAEQDVSGSLGIVSPALEYAQSIAVTKGAVLVLLHSIDPVGYAFPQGSPRDDFAGADAPEELAHVEAEMRAQHLPAHSVVGTEVIYQRILQAAQDHHADLIVLGTHVASPLGRLALGTAALQLLHSALCPVLCVPAQPGEATPSTEKEPQAEPTHA